MTNPLFETDLNQSVRQLLRVLHTSLPADASYLFSHSTKRNAVSTLEKRTSSGKSEPDLGHLQRSVILRHVVTRNRALCAGHYSLRVKSPGSRGAVSVPSSLLIIPITRGDGHGEEREQHVLCFVKMREDGYRDEDLHFLRTMVRRYRLFLDHVSSPPLDSYPHTLPEERLETAMRTPHILANLLSSFMTASRRVLPIDALILTLWDDVVKEGEFLQVVGCSEEELSASEWIDKRQILARHLGDPLRVKNFSFYYKRCKLRLDLEEFIPRLATSVSARLTRGDTTVGTISLKSTEPDLNHQMAAALPDLVPPILWELQVAMTRLHWRKREKGTELSTINTRSFQDNLIRHFKFASRYGEPLSALIFTPASPHRYSEVAEQSAARLFTLMRKSIRAIDSACYFGVNGFTMLLPRATYREALKVADRLMNLADQVLKHDRYLGKKFSLSYRVVSYPESARNDVDLWEAIVDAVPV